MGPHAQAEEGGEEGQVNVGRMMHIGTSYVRI